MPHDDDFESCLTCVHQPFSETGLCEKCADLFEEDPSAWFEFGVHPQGIRNRRALDDEIRREAEQYRNHYPGRPDDEDSAFPFET